jgi:hypothetical protein
VVRRRSRSHVSVTCCPSVISVGPPHTPSPLPLPRTYTYILNLFLRSRHTMSQMTSSSQPPTTSLTTASTTTCQRTPATGKRPPPHTHTHTHTTPAHPPPGFATTFSQVRKGCCHSAVRECPPVPVSPFASFLHLQVLARHRPLATCHQQSPARRPVLQLKLGVGRVFGALLPQ